MHPLYNQHLGTLLYFLIEWAMGWLVTNTKPTSRENIFTPDLKWTGDRTKWPVAGDLAPAVTGQSARPHLSNMATRRLRVSSGALGCTWTGLPIPVLWNSSRSSWKSCCTEMEVTVISPKCPCHRTCWIRELLIKSTAGSKQKMGTIFWWEQMASNPANISWCLSGVAVCLFYGCHFLKKNKSTMDLDFFLCVKLCVIKAWKHY